MLYIEGTEEKMAIPLAEEDIRAARVMLSLMGELAAGSREEQLFRLVYNDISLSLTEAARQVDFTWPIHLPLEVLLRLWFTFRSQEYQMEISFKPQKLTVTSYA